jgi:hypothetical protein
VYALSARLAESEGSATLSRDPTRAINLVGLEEDGEPQISDERSAHDYESRMDLAAAYQEMGRTQAAVAELLAAMESALLCGDYLTALRCVGQLRRTADSPAIRDRICGILTRHAPGGEQG